MEKTYAMIRPDAVQRNVTGRIIFRLDEAGFNICELRMATLTQEKARNFYALHEGRPFVEDLIDSCRIYGLKRSSRYYSATLWHGLAEKCYARLRFGRNSKN